MLLYIIIVLNVFLNVLSHPSALRDNARPKSAVSFDIFLFFDWLFRLSIACSFFLPLADGFALRSHTINWTFLEFEIIAELGIRLFSGGSKNLLRHLPKCFGNHRKP